MPAKKPANEVSIESILDGSDAPKITKAAVAPVSTGVNAELATEMIKIENRTKSNYQELLKSDKFEVSISPMYKPYFGEVMAVGLNGLFIYVACDGKRYSVPKEYASIIATRIRGVDDMLARRNKMADVQETHAGQLALVPR